MALPLKLNDPVSVPHIKMPTQYLHEIQPGLALRRSRH